MNIAELYNDGTPDEMVYGVGGAWYAAYRSDLAVLTNVHGKITSYRYDDDADMESAMRAIRRYGRVEERVEEPKPTPTSPGKGGDIIDAFFRAEGETRDKWD